MTNMKKVLFAILAAFSLQVATAQDKKVDFNELPADAINFVRQHFLVNDITSVWKDVDYKDEEYSVIFKDGLEIEFNGEGDWKEIKVHTGKVPDHVVPEKILAHVTATFPFESVKEISHSINKKTYKVKVTDGQKLKFDDNFNFIKLK